MDPCIIYEYDKQTNKRTNEQNLLYTKERARKQLVNKESKKQTTPPPPQKKNNKKTKQQIKEAKKQREACFYRHFVRG